MKRAYWIGLMALVVGALACNAPGQVTPTNTAGAVATDLPTQATSDPTAEATSTASSDAPTIPAGWLTYRDEAHGFEVSSPDSGIPINSNPPTVGDEESVRIDLPFAPDTNLGEKYLQIDVRSGSETCISPYAEGFDPSELDAETVMIGGRSWQKTSRMGVAAGNIYEFTAYSTAQNGVCVVLTFVLHSYNTGNFPTPPAEFDRAAESAVFEEIAATFRWLPS